MVNDLATTAYTLAVVPKVSNDAWPLFSHLCTYELIELTSDERTYYPFQLQSLHFRSILLVPPITLTVTKRNALLLAKLG